MVIQSLGDDELRFAMATEMDYSEAYGPYHNTRGYSC